MKQHKNENKTYKVLLLGGSFTAKNLGIRALTYGAIKCVVNQFPEAEIYMVDYGLMSKKMIIEIDNKKIPITFNNIRLSKKLFVENHVLHLLIISLIQRAFPIKKVKKYFENNNKTYTVLSGIDSVVSIAGGDSFSDIYGMERFLYIVFPQILMLVMKKKMVFLPQTIGPFKNKISIMIARAIMRKALKLYCRDHINMAEYMKLIGKHKAVKRLKFCHDVAFVLDVKKPEDLNLGGYTIENEAQDVLVGLNISGLLYSGGYSGNNMFNLKTDYKKIVIEIIRHILSMRSTVILLIPHVYGDANSRESDVTACEKVLSEFDDMYKGRLYCVPPVYDQMEIKYIIGKCSFFIGSRMHACIAALSQCVPAVGLAYSIKFKGVFNSIGFDDLVVDPRTLDQPSIIKEIESVYNKKEELSEALQIKMQQVKKDILNGFKL